MILTKDHGYKILGLCKTHLRSDHKDPTSYEGNFPMIESSYDSNNRHCICRSASKSGSCICKYRNKHMFLHIKCSGVEREFEPHKIKLLSRKNRSHEPPDWKSCHLNRYHGDQKRLGSVAEESVEKR